LAWVTGIGLGIFSCGRMMPFLLVLFLPLTLLLLFVAVQDCLLLYPCLSPLCVVLSKHWRLGAL
jgi:hypothetical protein